MGNWWESIRNWFQKRRPDSGTVGVREPSPAETRWLAADDPGNPFKVPILDLMLTQTLMAVTTDPDNAARSVCWNQADERALDPRDVLSRPPMDCSIVLPCASVLPSGIVYAPPAMEQKWVLAWNKQDGLLIAARSWTGVVEAVATAKQEGQALRLENLRVANRSVLRLGRLPEAFEWLVRCHALGQKLPFPATDEALAEFERAPMTAFSAFGSVIFCAGKSWEPTPIQGCLYSDGRVIRAVERRDIEALTAAVHSGEDVNAPSTHGGMTALHLAIAVRDENLLAKLLELGADISLRTGEQNSPLITGIIYRAPLHLLSLILKRAPDQRDASNCRGFAPIHAAAEYDNPEIATWLLAEGADLEQRTSIGFTPLHIACGLGHLAVAKVLLSAGANRQAHSPKGSPVEIAKRENHSALVELLTSR